MTDINSLKQILTPPTRPVEAVGDWDAAEQDLGTGLPDDYKEFINTYGSGMISELPIMIYNPFADSIGFPLKEGVYGHHGIMFAYQTLIDDEFDFGYDLFPEPGGLLPFGATGVGDYLNWKTGGDPNSWHVVVSGHCEREWHVFPEMGIVAFASDFYSFAISRANFWAKNI